MQSKVHVVLASDANYQPGLEVTRASIERSCRSPERLVWHVFDEQALDGVVPNDLPLWNTSRMPYLRLWLPEMLKDVDWVIYADVDTIWNRDICELWDSTVSPLTTNNQPLTTSPSIYWVRDFVSMKSCAGEWMARVTQGEGIAFDWTRYACSGVCVLNLRKMRETGFTRRVLDLFAKYGVPKFPDQDVLNVLFNSDSGMLPCVWDVLGDCSNLPREGERCVYHLTGVGRHFHDATPTTYPPQYQLWWNTRRAAHEVAPRSRLLAALWPLRNLTRLLPLRTRERIFRQLFFAKVLENKKIPTRN